MKKENEFKTDAENPEIRQKQTNPMQSKTDEDEEIKKLNEKEILGESKKIEEITDALKRLQAEFENYKKRVDKEKSEFAAYACSDIVEKLLPVMDSFEIALKNTSEHEKFVKGIQMIYSQIYSILSSNGLKKIDAVGKKFDPYKHEVLMKEESEKEDDIVLEEFQKGYMLNDKVIRHSKVKVSGK